MNLVTIRFNYNGSILELNQSAVKEIGYDSEDLSLGCNIFDFLLESDRDTFKSILDKSKKKQLDKNFEFPIITKSGDTSNYIWGIKCTDSKKLSFEINGMNINEILRRERKLESEHKDLQDKYAELQASQKSLKKTEERYRLIIDASYTGIWDWDLTNNEKFYSNKWYENMGLKPGECENEIETWEELIDPDDFEKLLNLIDKHFAEKSSQYEFDYRIRTKTGELKWIRAIGRTLWDENGNPVRRAGSDTDITKLKDYENRLHYLAHRDYLTGLPNRLMLHEKLFSMINEENNMNFAVLFIDSDNFKLVNDTFGHQFGDQLIIEIGRRIESFLDEDGMVFRIGGDEFIVLCSRFGSAWEIEKYAERIVEGFKKPFEIWNSVIDISVSVGVAIYPLHGRDSNELMKCSDIALYKAKELGKGRYEIFSKEMNDEIIERMNIEKSLSRALEKSEFVVYYQPQIDVTNHTVAGFEALVRWNSPEMGLVSPLKFIKIAEESKLIITLGRFVLHSSCMFIKKVHEMGFKDCTISVNISIIQLIQENFVDMVLKILNETHLEFKYLELEITESILMESIDEINKKLEVLRRHGIGIALDDFGKGYSSLNYLKRLSISTLKIDKSFIDSINYSEKDDTLTGNIIMIGRKMGLSIIAEGVETYDQFDYLKTNGCDKIQGFLFSKPLPEDDAIQLLQKGIQPSE